MCRLICSPDGQEAPHHPRALQRRHRPRRLDAPAGCHDDEEHGGAQADDAEGLRYELADTAVEREVPLPLPPLQHVPQRELERAGREKQRRVQRCPRGVRVVEWTDEPALVREQRPERGDAHARPRHQDEPRAA